MSAAEMIRRFLSVIALLAVAACGSDGASSTPAQSAKSGASATAPTYAAYAWNADEIVSRWKAGTLWSLAETLHVDDFMLGFTDADIATYSRKNGTAEMNALIAEGKRHGIAFDLLLGDPSWILPKGIPGLERILRRLHAVRFAGVNLDLEPNELSKTPIKTAVMDLVSAMKQYVAVSPWPVTLDANWIYMNNGNTFNGGYCFPCGLKAAGVKRIALMVYISSPKTAYAVSAPILKRYSSFTFTIGQSVEPPSVLPKRDSYWQDGFTAFYADMQKVDAKCRVLPNYAGLAVESLQYLETMPS
ncbi:MAG TPA: hypothetical protein VFE36_16490 [Candidatus Baltobacteraceae bacterium]|nr:hypothetical protein [Candidatus Baltobacteraceae bacterium]